MPFASLASTTTTGQRPSSKGQISSRQTLATAVAPVTTWVSPPQNASIVADYLPYTQKYRYNTLLHHPPSDVGAPYNTSGYFTIMGGAYLPDCTNTIIRPCNKKAKMQFTTE